MGLLDGKRTIVTGAGSGIGRAIAARFVREGAGVVACDRVSERVESTARELRDDGQVVAVAGDVADAAVCERLVAAATAELGGVDIVVNNAGIVRFEPFLDHGEESWDRTLSVDLKAVFLLSQRAARRMVAQGSGGVILSTASANGLVAEPGVAAYNAAKAGVVLLTQTMAIELAAHGIRAVCVAPGHIGPTKLAVDGGAPAAFMGGLEASIPLGRLGRVDEVAGLFAYLASDGAGFINGSCVVIDGGQLSVQYGSTLARP